MKPIPGYPDYFAGESGDIYSMKPLGNSSAGPESPRLLKKTMFQRPRDSAPYYYVGLYGGRGYGKRGHRVFAVARLVLAAFVGPQLPGMFACHGPKGSLDDSIGNVYWATPKRNAADQRRDGTAKFGERSGTAKLNALQVSIIRKSYSPAGVQGLSAHCLALTFGVKTSTVQDVIHRRTWPHIP